MAKKTITWPILRSCKLPSGKKGWVVDATLKGNRDRRYFKTKAEAEVCQAQKHTERENLGIAVLSMSEDLRREAIELDRKLRLVGHTLTSAVDFFIKHARPSSAQKTVKEVIAELKDTRSKSGLSKEYLRIQASVLGNFSKTFGERPINTVLTPDIRQWMDSHRQWKPETRNNYRKDLRSLWNFALDNGYVPLNPLDRIKPHVEEKLAPGILTPVQAEALLAQAAKVKGSASLLPFVAIGLFCGLRSAEVVRLDWKEVDLPNRLIEVAAKKAKTRQRRNVHISDNLALWLSTYASPSGRVVPADRPEGILGRLAKRAKIIPWPKNALRHSFASYHLAEHKDAARTALEMGHSNQNLLFSNYRNVVKAPEAAAYWKIVPSEAP